MSEPPQNLEYSSTAEMQDKSKAISSALIIGCVIGFAQSIFPSALWLFEMREATERRLHLFWAASCLTSVVWIVVAYRVRGRVPWVLTLLVVVLNAIPVAICVGFLAWGVTQLSF